MTEPERTSNQEEPPLQISFLDSGSQLKAMDSTQLLYLLADIRPPDTVQPKNNLPLNISLVIDKSTSMKGDRINKVRAAAGHIIEKLSTRDYISVISFSDRAEVIVPSSQPTSPQDLLSRLNGIVPSGGTEIFQGLAASYREVAKVELGKYVNHIILLTDGQTYGDSKLCLELAEKAAQLGIGISGFGIGDEWNDKFLDDLASFSGGQSGYIQEPEQVIHLLRQRIQSLGALYASNTQIKFDMPNNFGIRKIYKLTPFFQPLKVNDNIVSAGAIESRTPLGILAEIEVSGLATSSGINIPLQVKAQIPDASPPGFALTLTHTVNPSGENGTPMPDAIIQAVRMLNLYRMNENLWEDLDQSGADNVVKRMDLLTRRFEEAGMDQMANHIRQSTRVFEAGDQLQAGDRLEVKYGTRMHLTSMLQTTLDSGALDAKEGDSE